MASKPHKHRDTIVAWADGADIQYQHPHTKEWVDIPTEKQPEWYAHISYRVSTKETLQKKKDKLAQHYLRELCR